MKALGLAIALVLGAAACGDNHSSPDAAFLHDSSIDGPGSDGSVPISTFTAFVIDQIKNHTTATGTGVPYTMFSTLADPDATSNNGSAYSTLFQ